MNLANVFNTFADVSLSLPLLRVVGVYQNGGVGIQGQLHHLPANVWLVGQGPQ